MFAWLERILLKCEMVNQWNIDLLPCKKERFSHERLLKIFVLPEERFFLFFCAGAGMEWSKSGEQKFRRCVRHHRSRWIKGGHWNGPRVIFWPWVCQFVPILITTRIFCILEESNFIKITIHKIFWVLVKKILDMWRNYNYIPYKIGSFMRF